MVQSSIWTVLYGYMEDFRVMRVPLSGIAAVDRLRGHQYSLTFVASAFGSFRTKISVTCPVTITDDHTVNVQVYKG